MSRRPQRQAEAGILAVLSRAGETWSGIIVNTGATPPEIIESRTFAGSRALELNGWVEEHKAAEALVVLPAGSAICRTCALPAAEPDQLEQALHLQAEAHLLGTAPPHRTGMAVLEAAPGETSRSGVVLAWPESAKAELPAIEAPLAAVPPAAALAALIDADRPTHPLVWVDRSDGSVALAITHANGAVFRSTREDIASDITWQPALARVITETALGVGHTPEFTRSIVDWAERGLASVGAGKAGLLLPDEVIEQNTMRVADAPRDPEWWSTFGLAVGAVLARVGSLAPLTHLLPELPSETPSLMRRATESLSQPRTAVRAAIAALLILAFGPLIFHGLRLQVLKIRHGNLGAQLTAIDDARALRAMYEHLADERWTMTKVLGDLACNTPEGVDLERIRINHPDSVTVSGSVDPDRKTNRSAREVAAQMQSQLQDSGLFSKVTSVLENPDNFGTYQQFSLSAEVIRPHRRVEYEEAQDFAVLTLRDRMYPPEGDSAEAVPVEIELAPEPEPEPEPETEIARAPDPEDKPRPRQPMGAPRPGGGQDTKSRTGGDSSSSARPIEADIPPKLSEEQVEAMSRGERIRMMGRIAKARSHAKTTSNKELEERLNSDWELLKSSIGRK